MFLDKEASESLLRRFFFEKNLRKIFELVF